MAGEYSELCDIMVSELLGSFGDNELSPECLDGAQRCMKQDGSMHSYICTVCMCISYLVTVPSKIFILVL
jgi:hypothetical protein